MANIFVTSDTHFNHSNFLNFTDENGKKIRPFSDVNEMNECMIERWNSVVKPGDKIYHLGDVYFGSQVEADVILSRLNGQKRLIVGNHDCIYGKGNILQKHFKKIYMWRMMPEHGILMSHVPVHQSTLRENRFKQKSMTNIHGHIHQNNSPDGPYRNVSVERCNYFPLSIEGL